MARLAFKVLKEAGIDMSLGAFVESFIRLAWLVVFFAEFVAVGVIFVYFTKLPSPWSAFAVVGAATLLVSMTLGWLYDIKEWRDER